MGMIAGVASVPPDLGHCRSTIAAPKFRSATSPTSVFPLCLIRQSRLIDLNRKRVDLMQPYSEPLAEGAGLIPSHRLCGMARSFKLIPMRYFKTTFKVLSLSPELELLLGNWGLQHPKGGGDHDAMDWLFIGVSASDPIPHQKALRASWDKAEGEIDLFKLEGDWLDDSFWHGDFR
jgi:hypothetical protein